MSKPTQTYEHKAIFHLLARVQEMEAVVARLLDEAQHEAQDAPPLVFKSIRRARTA